MCDRSTSRAPTSPDRTDIDRGARASAPAIVVDLDGDPVEYYPAEVALPPESTADLLRYEYRIDALLAHHPRVRRAVVRLRTARDVFRMFGALRWGDGTDLDELDRRLAAGDHAGVADALAATVFCVADDVTCLRCGNSSLVLAVEPGVPGVSPARERAHSWSTECPACGDRRFRPHVEVLA